MASPDQSASDEAFMRLALAEAERALDYCEVPVGCVIVKGEDVIATGFNLTNETCDATRHAELVALDAFFARNEVAPDYFADCVLYVTIEPCIMCASALSMIGLGMVVFGGHNEHFGGCGSRLRLHDPGALPRPFRGLDTQSGVLQKESVDILRTFYGRRNPRGKGASFDATAKRGRHATEQCGAAD